MHIRTYRAMRFDFPPRSLLFSLVCMHLRRVLVAWTAVFFYSFILCPFSYIMYVIFVCMYIHVRVTYVCVCVYVCVYECYVLYVCTYICTRTKEQACVRLLVRAFPENIIIQVETHKNSSGPRPATSI